MNHLSWRIDKVIEILASTSSMWKTLSSCQIRGERTYLLISYYNFIVKWFTSSICFLLKRLESPTFAFEVYRWEFPPFRTFPIRRFSMNLPTCFTCMLGFMAMVKQDSRLFKCLAGVIKGFHACLFDHQRRIFCRVIRFFSNHNIPAANLRKNVINW